MNTNEAIHNRNAETAPRLRFNNEPIMQNHIVYPYTYPMHPLFYPITQPVIMTTNHSQLPTINTTDQSNEQSGIMSPSSDTSVNQPPYRISTWQDIVDNYEGHEEKPKCGKLKDNVYFTQRSASSDMYMLFDRKSDYINNFVNYYFSDKNLARDHKLVALMDDNGVVPLSALAKFPKLHQIETTVDDLVKAFQINHFVAAVDMQNNEKGAQRRDKLCSADVANRNGFDNSSNTKIVSSFSEINIANSEPSSNSIINSVPDLHMTVASDVGLQPGGQVAPQGVQGGQQPPNQSYYVYNQAALLPTLYNHPPALQSPYTNPYIMTNFPFAGTGAVGAPPTAQGGHIYPGSLVWPAASVADYGGHALIQQQQQHSGSGHHNNGAGTGGNARFLSSAVSSINGGFNVAASAVTGVPEPVVANRMN